MIIFTATVAEKHPDRAKFNVAADANVSAGSFTLKMTADGLAQLSEGASVAVTIG